MIEKYKTNTNLEADSFLTDEDEKGQTKEVAQGCKHDQAGCLIFSHPGQGHYDVYRCKVCNTDVTMRWSSHV